MNKIHDSSKLKENLDSFSTNEDAILQIAHTDMINLTKLINEKENEIITFKKKKESLKIQITNLCKKIHSLDFWEKRRENGPYGNRFFFCNKCKLEI